MIDNALLKKLAKSVTIRARDNAKAMKAERVLAKHQARRVASRVLISKKAPDDLIAECQYWTKELGRKLKAKTSLIFTRQGGCRIDFSEDWGGYSIEANEIGNVIVWSSGRDKAANLPREIEKLAQKSKRTAMALYRENSPSVSEREVAYRWASKEGCK